MEHWGPEALLQNYLQLIQWYFIFFTVNAFLDFLDVYFPCNGILDALGKGFRIMNDAYRSISNSLLLD